MYALDVLSVPGGHGVGDLTIDDGGPMADPHQAFGPAEYRWPPTDAEPTLERPHKDAYEGRFMADSCPFICNRRERCANGSARPAADVDPGATCATAFSGTTVIPLTAAAATSPAGAPQ